MIFRAAWGKSFGEFFSSNRGRGTTQAVHDGDAETDFADGLCDDVVELCFVEFSQ